MSAEEYIVSLIERLEADLERYNQLMVYPRTPDPRLHGRIGEIYTILGMLKRDLKEIKDA